MKRGDIDDIILKFCTDALCDGHIPDRWKLSNIVPVPKKGDLTKTDNYRRISLTSIVNKPLNRMLLNRIKPSLEEVLRDNQNGFRPGRSTTSHILALRRIIEGAKPKTSRLMKILNANGKLEIIVTLRPARSRRIGSQQLADVEFADDVALITDTIVGAKLLLDRLEKAAQSVGLVMN